MATEELEELIDGTIGVDRTDQAGRVVGSQSAGQGQEAVPG
jgi:hypothetical protein